MKINIVTVIGANGIMGINISAIFASFGNAKVYMICRNLESGKKAAFKAAKSVRALSIMDNLIPKTYDDLEFCIKESNLVFESVLENIEVKKSINEMIMKYVNNNTIISTGTSSISINLLKSSFNKEVQKRYLGLHFYNPPYIMNLCEVIPSEDTDTQLVIELKDYLSKLLYRKVVIVKDSPAFLGNRIGFQFINEAIQYSENYKYSGGIDYIDSILGTFTGRNMPPILTADFVGLDIYKSIVKIIYENTDDFLHQTFIVPDFVDKLINKGNIGVKARKGFYETIKHIDNTKTINVYDICSGEYRPRESYGFKFSRRMIEEFKLANYNEGFKQLVLNDSLEAHICLQFIIKYVIYSLYISINISESVCSVDDVMATGFKWIPPLALVDLLGGSRNFIYLADKFLDSDIMLNIDIEKLFSNIPPSKYDYRPFLKAN